MIFPSKIALIREYKYENMQLSPKITPETVSYQCNCNNEKKIRTVEDGGFGDKFTVEYCQKCYDQENKEFEISMENIS